MKVLDVGGVRNTYGKATHVIDAMPKPKDFPDNIEYVKYDVCDGNWPYEDKEFDYVYCSNLLEDVKDPIIVCKEMIRVGKAGEIIVPSVLTECRIGIDNKIGFASYAGFCHHRWFCFVDKDYIYFVPKLPISHVANWTEGIPQEVLDERYYDVINWKGTFKFEEFICGLKWEETYMMLAKYFNKDPLGVLKCQKES